MQVHEVPHTVLLDEHLVYCVGLLSSYCSYNITIPREYFMTVAILIQMREERVMYFCYNVQISVYIETSKMIMTSLKINYEYIYISSNNIFD